MDENYANRLNWFRQFKEKIKGSTKTLVIGIDVAKDSHIQLRFLRFEQSGATGRRAATTFPRNAPLNNAATLGRSVKVLINDSKVADSVSFWVFELCCFSLSALT